MSRKRAAKATVRNNVYQLEQALAANGRAWDEGPTRRKTWSKHDLTSIRALTPPQHSMMRDFFEGNHVVAHGSAGTGKSFVAVYLALSEVLDPNTETDKVIIVRSAVPGREMGFLPGTEEEKEAVYERPYPPIFSKLLGRSSTYNDMKTAGIVEFETTAYLRGLTWENAVVIVDEGQNMSFEEINTVMTRLGEGSRMIFCGDLPQKDLKKRGDETGFPKFIRIAERMGSFGVSLFTKYDIVRGGFCKEWIITCEDDGE
jgi:phosphate starvation-inducible protein PhoH and related proteins